MMFLTLALTMIIGFAYIGFSDENKDPNEVICWANSTNNLPFPKRVYEDPDLVSEWNIKNVSQRFKILFNTGFYIMVICLVLWIIYYFPCIQDNKRLSKIGQIILASATVIYMGFFITSNVFRFDHTGRVCSGEYGWLPKNTTTTEAHFGNTS